MSKLDQDLALLVREIVRDEIRHALVKPPRGETWTPFRQEVYRVVAMIPPGQVASYGDVAERMGRSPGTSRAVGRALGKLGYDCRYLPWWRVVRDNGELPKEDSASPEDRAERRHLMELEGIEIDEKRRVPEKCFWR
jgi:methylated-DNA-protein-cysteine methyltransferase-like protein